MKIVHVLLLLAVFGSALSVAETRSERHRLTVVHPGDPSHEPRRLRLEQDFDAQGDPVSYRATVDSVICRESSCDIVDVELTWDALGRYQNYRVKKGRELTKIDHVPFTAADYEKLQRILSDPKSPLREVDKDSMTGKKTASAVDGVVGATALTLKDNVVLGAGYTCYDLWHWANILFREHIRDLTGKTCRTEKLLAYLEADDPNTVRFALQKLRQREAFGDTIYKAVIARSKAASSILTKPALLYLRDAAASAEAYDAAICELFAAGASAHRAVIVTALTKESRPLSHDLLERLSAQLPRMQSYYEVHLLLNLLEREKAGSAETATHAAALLGHEKFFMARRAYWHLQKQELSASIQKQMNTFATAHAERL